jgi:hypothetical protein
MGTLLSSIRHLQQWISGTGSQLGFLLLPDAQLVSLG